ncbi:hypothetical protein PIB30_030033 [Stylosanthes scabra]|uniref:CCHC-type domain-containing protein n=1 Tax=Stylosanthes scabra TaxID=79078 RepID=A0ABU6SC89_9FABA|nr:hypothetical protein [Stylosanthes scabra]
MLVDGEFCLCEGGFSAWEHRHCNFGRVFWQCTMVYFHITVFHKGYFWYVEGAMRETAKQERRRGPDEEDRRNQTHLSRVGQIQRCGNCGAAGHKRGGCPKPPKAAQPPKKTKTRSSSKGKGQATTKHLIRAAAKSLSQPTPQPFTRKRKLSEVASSLCQPNSSNIAAGPSQSSRGRVRVSTSNPKPATQVAKPNPPKKSAAVKPNPQKKSAATTRLTGQSSSQPTKITNAAPKLSSKPSSSRPTGQRPIFCVRNVGGVHVSPQKLRKMARLPPRAWNNIYGDYVTS